MARAASVLPVLVDRYQQYDEISDAVVLDSLHRLLPDDR
jgi:hypothetical protein